MKTFADEDPLLFEQIELPAKLLDYFLGSNKRNINQSVTKTLSAGET